MFRDLDDSEVPSQVAGQSVDDPLHAVFQQRIDAERQKKADSGNTQNWQRWMADPVEDQARTDAAKAKRDSWVYEDAEAVRALSPEASGNYKSSGSNEKYVKYYDPESRDMEYNGAFKRPPHPRQRHRCDYHLEDVIQSASDRKYPVWDTFKVWISCMWSPVGEEPERLRKEVWRW